MPSNPTILLIAASRGLGLAMAEEFLKKDWSVVGTVRGTGRTKLHDLADHYPGRLEIESVDICEQSQVTSLHQRLAGRAFQMLFVNAGITNKNPNEAIGEVSTDEFIRVMVTNALCPMRVVESLQDLVTPDGLVGVMSSGQGSITNNVKGLREVYRGSKAALNQFMRSFAARQAETFPSRSLVVTAPGWVQTELGGASAPLTISDSIPNLVNVLIAKQSRPGIEYLDYLGRTVPW
jgi:NAD(P)-dependent dehydrogenase (short-subunit alcohol dehydrogenase family)